jgi:hypothetical protein
MWALLLLLLLLLLSLCGGWWAHDVVYWCSHIYIYISSEQSLTEQLKRSRGDEEESAYLNQKIQAVIARLYCMTGQSKVQGPSFACLCDCVYIYVCVCLFMCMCPVSAGGGGRRTHR